MIKYRELTAEERIHDRIERQKKARRDQDMFLRWELKKSKLEIARNMVANGEPIDKITKYTDLSIDEIENLSHD